MQHPALRLESHRKKLLAGIPFHPDDFKDLWRLSGSADREISEAALDLLSSPPVEEEVAYWKAYADAALNQGATRLRDLPLPAFELVFDLWEQASALGIRPENAEACTSLLKRLPLKPLRRLLDQPYSLQAFLPHVGTRLAKRFQGLRSQRSKRRWRLLAQRLGASRNHPTWCRLTFGDLTPVLAPQLNPRRMHAASGAWLVRGRPLLLKPGPAQFPAAEPVVARAHWSGYGQLSMRWLGRLVERQAQELEAVRQLARAVSRQTGRVVFSWHNATLAAAGGWSFEDLDLTFPSPGLWAEFVSRIESRSHQVSARHGGESGAMERLWRMREERLIGPKIAHALQEACDLRPLGASWETVCEAARDSWIRFGGRLDPIEDRAAGRHAWVGPRSPAQRWPLSQVLEWWHEERKIWRRGLARLLAAAVEGQRLLSRGELDSFVLPWIDKFFISSLRRRDRLYLPALVQWISDAWEAPLILFWEDTIHASEPSFKLALDSMRARGLPFRGIGTFDSGKTQRRDALDIICSSQGDVSLFALRPLDDSHHSCSFHGMLAGRDFEILRRYDSSWKDNLSCLYIGTQVFPFVSDAGYRETLAGWVATHHQKMPFGAFFRLALRRQVPGSTPCESDDPWCAEYARWANLR